MTREVKSGSVFNILSAKKQLISAVLFAFLHRCSISAGAIVAASTEHLPAGGPGENGLARRSRGSIPSPGSNQPGRVELSHHPRGTA